MDRISEACSIVKEINSFQRTKDNQSQLISHICNYFDKMKNEELSNADKQFLFYIANRIGIPQYYEMLSKFKKMIGIRNLSLNSLSAMFNEASLYSSSDCCLHKYQKEVLDKFNPNKENRFLLTASTSFGKSFLVFEIIRKMNYKNVLLIYPTIALLSENLSKLLLDKKYIELKSKYSIHTISEIKKEDFGEFNIFIFTPERYLSFIDKYEHLLSFDFVFIDEIYKIDNGFEINDEERENERDISYRMTSFITAAKEKDILLAGPFLDNFKESFLYFLKRNRIIHLDYNAIEIVNKYFYKTENKQWICSDDFEKICFPKRTRKTEQLKDIVNTILDVKSNCLIYCANRGSNSGTEYYAKKLLDLSSLKQLNPSSYSPFLTHLKNTFDENWIVYKALSHGIGIHHGLIPKYIQKEIINLYNRHEISVLLSTTTITEGVNTSAKYLIIMHAKKGDKDLKTFDAKNIIGRAGRFYQHYSGKIIDLSKALIPLVKDKTDEIGFKYYERIDKDDIDLAFTEDDFLTDNDKAKKTQIKEIQEKLQIEDEILTKYRMISKLDKLTIYKNIIELPKSTLTTIQSGIKKYYSTNNFDLYTFQLIFHLLLPIIKNKELSSMIINQGQNPYCVLVYKINAYLRNGLNGLIDYSNKKTGRYDSAVSDSTHFVFNILKYHVVKYLGVFNLMYKYFLSKENNINFDEVIGIDRLLTKLEHNAITNIGIRVNDYGVPEKIVKYFEIRESSVSRAKNIRKDFDEYERKIFEDVKKIL